MSKMTRFVETSHTCCGRNCAGCLFTARVCPLGETEVFPREETVVTAGSVGKTEELGKTNKKEAQGTADGFPWTGTCG
jgi:hypothetical protein